MTNSIIIEAESNENRADIAAIQIAAFNHHTAEATIIALLRQREDFDSDLSLIAYMRDPVYSYILHAAGHILLTPSSIRLDGEYVSAVLVAPVGVHPRFQRSGVGSALIAAAHKIVRESDDEYQLAFLVGHPEYYSRFGYQKRAFGTSSLTVTTKN